MRLGKHLGAQVVQNAGTISIHVADARIRPTVGDKRTFDKRGRCPTIIINTSYYI